MPGDPPVRQRAEQAAEGADGRDQAEAHLAEAEALGGVEDQHRPRRAEGHVEHQDRQRERPHGRVVPGPADPLDDVVPDAGRRGSGSRPCCGSVILVSSATASSTTHGLRDERPAPSRARTGRPDRRADELVDGDEADLDARRWRCRGRRGRPASGGTCSTVLSAKTSAVPSRNIATSTSQIDTVSVRTDAARSSRTPTRSRSTMTTMSLRSSRSASAPASSAKRNGGSHRRSAAIATRNSWSVWDATSSGPAAIAMPSPRLLTQVEAISHRKPTPSRVGATLSSNPLTGSAR